jgi:hypothetical protein
MLSPKVVLFLQLQSHLLVGVSILFQLLQSNLLVVASEGYCRVIGGLKCPRKLLFHLLQINLLDSVSDDSTVPSTSEYSIG